jgi:pilus assembly protein Flp/PilA
MVRHWDQYGNIPVRNGTHRYQRPNAVLFIKRLLTSLSHPAQSHGNAHMNLIKLFLRDEGAATAIEYGLIAALIAVVIITALTTVGTKLKATFTSVSGSLSGS